MKAFKLFLTMLCGTLVVWCISWFVSTKEQRKILAKKGKSFWQQYKEKLKHTKILELVTQKG